MRWCLFALFASCSTNNRPEYRCEPTELVFINDGYGELTAYNIEETVRKTLGLLGVSCVEEVSITPNAEGHQTAWWSEQSGAWSISIDVNESRGIEKRLCRLFDSKSKVSKDLPPGLFKGENGAVEAYLDACAAGPVERPFLAQVDEVCPQPQLSAKQRFLRENTFLGYTDAEAEPLSWRALPDEVYSGAYTEPFFTESGLVLLNTSWPTRDSYDVYHPGTLQVEVEQGGSFMAGEVLEGDVHFVNGAASDEEFMAVLQTTGAPNYSYDLAIFNRLANSWSTTPVQATGALISRLQRPYNTISSDALISRGLLVAPNTWNFDSDSAYGQLYLIESSGRTTTVDLPSPNRPGTKNFTDHLWQDPSNPDQIIVHSTAWSAERFLRSPTYSYRQYESSLFHFNLLDQSFTELIPENPDYLGHAIGALNNGDLVVSMPVHSTDEDTCTLWGTLSPAGTYRMATEPPCGTTGWTQVANNQLITTSLLDGQLTVRRCEPVF